MKKFISSILATFSFLAQYSQGVITVQHGSITKLERRLDSAIIHAQSGDSIYLPGGLIMSGSSININKNLTIIGAGYNSDSSVATTPTWIQSPINLNPGSEGSFVTGIASLTSISVYASRITVSRCYFSFLSFQGNNSSFIVIDENVISGGISSSSGITLTDIVIKKNIVYGSISSGLEGAMFTNNILMTTQVGSFQIFQNNIFVYSSSGFSGSSQFKNNLFVSPFFTNSATNTGNISNEPLANIFVNYTSGGLWNTSQNFHLKAGCRGIGLGTDGYDAGIYGSSKPFKEGGIPFNPHFQAASIADATNDAGKLNINITVKAQDH